LPGFKFTNRAFESSYSVGVSLTHTGIPAFLSALKFSTDILLLSKAAVGS